jgi:hypothetical protein
MACRNEFIDHYIDPTQNIPFCKEDSLICSPLLEVVGNSRQFCEYMGFKVQSPLKILMVNRRLLN